MTAGFLAALVGAIVAIEIAGAVRLLRQFGQVAALTQRAGRLVVRQGVSEWAKEAAMQRLSLRLLGASLRAGLWLAAVALPVLLSLIVAERPSGIVAITALVLLTIAYSLLRRALRAPDQRDALLHRLTLGAAPVRAISHDLERALYLRRAPVRTPAPVFVTGLARAGTTILMRALHDTGDFASLSYRDLPLPLAPNLLAHATTRMRRRVTATERGHGDGILHDLDSPEAIEEVFWGHFEADAFRTPHALRDAPVAEDTVALFRDYVRLVTLRHGAVRYLSKNNTNILRLPALVAAFPDAMLVHPFRDPLQHAASLRNQHLRALALAKDDPARATFMAWMGHHEFGADHRPFAFGQAAPPAGDPGGIDYWLRQWTAVHRFLLDQPEPVRQRQCFVDYQALCEAPAAMAQQLMAQLGLGPDFTLAGLRAPPPHRIEPADPALSAEADRLFGQLRDRSVAKPW